MSDCINDYLFLYANAKEVHTDRVHACVAALAYGNPAKLYYRTRRAYLFRKVVDGDIMSNLVTANLNKLNKEKKKMILRLKEVVEDII